MLIGIDTSLADIGCSLGRNCVLLAAYLRMQNFTPPKPCLLDGDIILTEGWPVGTPSSSGFSADQSTDITLASSSPSAVTASPGADNNRRLSTRRRRSGNPTNGQHPCQGGCGKTFSQAFNMRKHYKYDCELGLRRRFWCSWQCGESFSRQSYRAKHEATHCKMRNQMRALG